jgi:hypothetical protein
MLWYGPLFGKLWLKVIGKNEKELKSSPGMYFAPMAGALVSAYILAVLISGLGVTVWWQGMLLGAAVWIGMGAAAVFTTGTFEGTPRAASVIYSAYQIVVFAVQGVLFSVWRI